MRMIYKKSILTVMFSFQDGYEQLQTPNIVSLPCTTAKLSTKNLNE